MPSPEGSLDDSKRIVLLSYWNRIRPYEGSKDNIGVIKGHLGIEFKSKLILGSFWGQLRVDSASRGVSGFMLGLWSLIGVMSGFVWPPWDHLGATGSIGNLSWAAKTRWDHLGATGSLGSLSWAAKSRWDHLGVLFGSYWNHRWVSLEHVFVVGSSWCRAWVLGPSQDHGVT